MIRMTRFSAFAALAVVASIGTFAVATRAFAQEKTVMAMLIAPPKHMSVPSAILVACASCEQRAQKCVELGGSQSNCFSSSRMAQCRKEGVYTAPSGNTFSACK